VYGYLWLGRRQGLNYKIKLNTFAKPGLKAGFCALKHPRIMQYSTYIHLAGVFFFGISGTMIAARARLDLFGLTFVACVGALGGGTIRDLLIGHYPLSWVKDPRYILAVLVGVFTALLFRRKLAAIRNFIFVVDSLGIGFFTVSGVRISLDAGLHPGIALLFGVLSVVLGGLLRDVICNEVPVILKKELVATASFSGGALFLLLDQLNIPLGISTVAGAGAVLLIRLLGQKYKWQLPVVSL
jgi:uncharacterized membrane protein YeiH